MYDIMLAEVFKMTYKDRQCQRIEGLIHQSNVFNGDPGANNQSIRKYSYLLRNGINNLYKPESQKMLAYMEKNGVSWWGGSQTGNPLSPQAACLNHLFPFREDAEAVLAIARKISPDIVRVLPIPTDTNAPAYIQFEAVSGGDYLNEGSGQSKRCTAPDALIYAQRADGKKLLLPIAWQYAEVYANEDKSVMVDENATGMDALPKENVRRTSRYNGLIAKSRQLLPPAGSHNVYYFEPFYRLMRQTLWAEQMILHRAEETLKADDFIHVHVAPCGNDELLRQPFACSGKMLESTWRDQLRDQNRYWLICPEFLLSRIDSGKYPEVFTYLRTRYW